MSHQRDRQRVGEDTARADAVLLAWLDAVELVLDEEPLEASAVSEVTRIGRTLLNVEDVSSPHEDESVTPVPRVLESLCTFRNPSQTTQYLSKRGYLHDALVQVASKASSLETVVGQPVIDVFTDPDEGDVQIALTVNMFGSAQDALDFLRQVDDAVLIPAEDERVRVEMLVEAVPHG